MSRDRQSPFLNYLAIAFLCLYVGFHFGKAAEPDTASDELYAVSASIHDTWNQIEREYDISLDMAYTALDEAMHGHMEWRDAMDYLEAVDDLIDFVEELRYETENRAEELEAEES